MFDDGEALLEVWTTDTIADNAENWNLACDQQLLRHLQELSTKIISGVTATKGRMDGLMNKLNDTGLKLNMVNNRLQCLHNTQFIESRVYEDDEEDMQTLDSESMQTKPDCDNALSGRLYDEALSIGLKFLETKFDKVDIDMSDSEDDSEGPRHVYRPKDPYLANPLPHIIGSKEWYNKWHVGLLDSDEELENSPHISSSNSSIESLGPEDHPDFQDENSDGVVSDATCDNTSRRTEEAFPNQLTNALLTALSENANRSVINTRPIHPINAHTSRPIDLFQDEPPPMGSDTENPDDLLPVSTNYLFDKPTVAISNTSQKSSQNLKQTATSISKQTERTGLVKNIFEDDDESDEDWLSAEQSPKKTAPYLPQKWQVLPSLQDTPPTLPQKASTDRNTSSVAAHTFVPRDAPIPKAVPTQSIKSTPLDSKMDNISSYKPKPGGLFDDFETGLFDDDESLFGSIPKKVFSSSLFDDNEDLFIETPPQQSDLLPEPKRDGTQHVDTPPYQLSVVYDNTIVESAVVAPKQLEPIPIRQDTPKQFISLFEDFPVQEQDEFVTFLGNGESGNLFDDIFASGSDLIANLKKTPTKKPHKVSLFDDELIDETDRISTLSSDIKEDDVPVNIDGSFEKIVSSIETVVTEEVKPSSEPPTIVVDDSIERNDDVSYTTPPEFNIPNTVNQDENSERDVPKPVFSLFDDMPPDLFVSNDANDLFEDTFSAQPPELDISSAEWNSRDTPPFNDEQHLLYDQSDAEDLPVSTPRSVFDDEPPELVPQQSVVSQEENIDQIDVDIGTNCQFGRNDWDNEPEYILTVNQTSTTSGERSKPGKLQHSLNINVAALMPGASRPIQNTETPTSNSTVACAQESIDETDPSFSSLPSETLICITKDRARIPSGRKPSTRRARQMLRNQATSPTSLTIDSVRKLPKGSLFGDDTDDNDELFYNSLQPSPLHTSHSAEITNTSDYHDMTDDDHSKSKSSKHSKIFDDDVSDDLFTTEKMPHKFALAPKTRSLFDDDDDDDNLFGSIATKSRDVGNAATSTSTTRSVPVHGALKQSKVHPAKPVTTVPVKDPLDAI